MHTLRSTLIGITFVDGNISIMRFITTGRGDTLPPGAQWISSFANTWNRPATDENIISEIKRTYSTVGMNGEYVNRPVVAEWCRLNPDAIPSDRTYRKAWIIDGTNITHDIRRAESIALEQVYEQRKLVFENLDKELFRAMVIEDVIGAKDVEMKRRKFCDLQVSAEQKLASATTIDEIYAAVLSVKE